MTENIVRGSLFLDTRRMCSPIRPAPQIISITQRFRPRRRRVERFIEQAYACHYGSSIKNHYPTLMSVHDHEGRTLAAVGFRGAADEPLYLEHYLPAAIETMLGKALGRTVAREKIVEIGNLASDGQGASIFLYVTLAAYLRQQGYSHAAVTATRALRRAFRFMGVSPLELGAADRRLLPDEGRSWGRYYASDPQILAGGIAACFARIERYLPAAHNGGLDGLFSQLHYPVENTPVESPQ